ncbi:unnamed protein product [Allacma fusca]|uniref:Rhodanese domain-containing protein n=1 Tax=Allacma fusca TaxID=39272 RepID=A0A8J2LME9_9HEXA|nr:unnamed protein product [Allacma fusca]
MGDETTPEIEYEALAAGVKDGSLIVIDVRNPEEIASQGRIPGSINIPLPEVPDVFKNLSDEEFASRFGFNKKSSKPLVFSCRSGRRAEAAIDNLLPFGLPNNYLLYRGSWSDWVEKGGEVEQA